MEVQLNELETMLFENRMREDERELAKMARIQKRLQRLDKERAQRNMAVDAVIAKAHGAKLTGRPTYRQGANGLAIMTLPDPKPEPAPPAPAPAPREAEEPTIKMLPKVEEPAAAPSLEEALAAK